MRLVESLATGSIGQSTRKEYQRKWNAWAQPPRLRNKSPWLCDDDEVDSAINAPEEFMTRRCDVHTKSKSDSKRIISSSDKILFITRYIFRRLGVPDHALLDCCRMYGDKQATREVRGKFTVRSTLSS